MNATEERNYNIIRQNIIDYANSQRLSGIMPSEELADKMLNSVRKHNPTQLRRLVQSVPA